MAQSFKTIKDLQDESLVIHQDLDKNDESKKSLTFEQQSVQTKGQYRQYRISWFFM